MCNYTESITLTNRLRNTLKEYIALYIGHDGIAFVNSGTTALELCIAALNLPSDSAILIPSIGCDAIAMSVLNCGFIPYFYEVGNNLDFIFHKPPSNTAAIILVYHFGFVPDGATPNSIKNYRKRGWKIIADCSQAFDTRIDGFHVGLFADCAIYSFADGKQIECGEGGAVLCQDRMLLQQIELLANCGRQTGTYNRHIIGRNVTMARPVMSELLMQLKIWPESRRSRLLRTNTWREVLKDSYLKIVEPLNKAEIVPHKLVIRLDEITLERRQQVKALTREYSLIQDWWPKVPMEKSYLKDYYQPYSSLAKWRENGILLGLTPRISESCFKENVQAVSNIFKFDC